MSAHKLCEHWECSIDLFNDPNETRENGHSSYDYLCNKCYFSYFDKVGHTKKEWIELENQRYPHRGAWREKYGHIPYRWHIHHIDGNHNNNELTNLVCVPPQLHWDLHFVQALEKSKKDEAACRLLLKQWNVKPRDLKRFKIKW